MRWSRLTFMASRASRKLLLSVASWVCFTSSCKSDGEILDDLCWLSASDYQQMMIINTADSQTYRRETLCPRTSVTLARSQVSTSSFFNNDAYVLYETYFHSFKRRSLWRQIKSHSCTKTNSDSFSFASSDLKVLKGESYSDTISRNTKFIMFTNSQVTQWGEKRFADICCFQ